jgi:glycosyltransferase involved in cell wall biosynthesis
LRDSTASGRLPVFIISFNRGAFLRQVIASYVRQTMPVDIVVHDNGSTDPFTLDVLADLQARGIIVHRRPPIKSARELSRVDRTVGNYFGWFRKRSRYVVTDCDIDLSSARPEALQVYSELLDQFPHAGCVGPMLRIADVPQNYQLFNHVMNRHIGQFWHRQPEWTQTRFGQCAFIKATIDTTFAMHREGSRFRRLKNGLRVYHPFEARHLDWYPDDAQHAYRQTSSAAISHWNNASQVKLFAHEPLRFDRYNVVETAGDGRLVVRCRTPGDLPDQPARA